VPIQVFRWAIISRTELATGSASITLSTVARRFPSHSNDLRKLGSFCQKLKQCTLFSVLKKASLDLRDVRSQAHRRLRLVAHSPEAWSQRRDLRTVLGQLRHGKACFTTVGSARYAVLPNSIPMTRKKIDRRLARVGHRHPTVFAVCTVGSWSLSL
jgi:hypothetical protein